jgi:hypothetical protein
MAIDSGFKHHSNIVNRTSNNMIVREIMFMAQQYNNINVEKSP